MSKFGVLGSGVVGEALSNGLLQQGHAVMRGSRQPSALGEWRNHAGPNASTGTFAETAQFGEQLVLAVKGTAAEAALELAGAENLSGKLVIDTTNPIAELPPVNGVLQFFTGPNSSLMERLQTQYPEARFVKCFSCVGSPFMVSPDFGGQRPTMFICGNDADSKRAVTALLEQFGWDWEDMGGVEAARAIEPLCQLWCLPGLRGGSWSHAFKLLKK